MPDSGSHLIRTDHRIPWDEPYDYAAVLGFLQTRALSGIESVVGLTYRRTFSLHEHSGIFTVSCDAQARCLVVSIWYPEREHTPEILDRISRIFGIDQPAAPAVAALADDPVLGTMVRERPGLRIPGAWDAFEIAVRAVTGQQVTLQAATAMVGRAARICGTATGWKEWEELGLVRLFPEPMQLAQADLFDVGMPQHRMAALRSLALNAASTPDLFASDPASVRKLLAQPGIGDWTVQYIAMRAHRNPDAFPSADVVIRRMLTVPGETRPTPAAVLRRAEAWRPWRAWATIHLWTAAAAESRDTMLAKAAGA